jgi:flagellar assembly factor FliW
VTTTAALLTSHLTFVAPPPGLAPHVAFQLDDVEGAPGLHSLRAADDAGVRLFVVDAAMYVPDYAPQFSPEHLSDVGAASPQEAEVLVVTTLDDDGPALNLFAPVLVNVTTGAASQVILDGTDWPLRARLAKIA